MKNDLVTERKPRAAKRRTLETLKPNECRWPIGDPRLPDFHFCGEVKKDGAVYCVEHAALASTPGRPRAITFRHGSG